MNIYYSCQNFLEKQLFILQFNGTARSPNISVQIVSILEYA
jgi:hypothetical protein